MRITDMLRFAAERGEPVFSFEFFPPRNDAGVASLFDTLRALRPLAPSFVSVTWGAGGSSRGRTLEMVTRIKKETEIEAMAHLTCVGVSKKELEEQLAVICDAGISNVLALRGDPPRGQREFIVHPEGLSHASELVALAREVSEKRGAQLPHGLDAALRSRREDHESALQLGVAFAALQCADLLKQGAPGIHFYTLNKSTATRAILAALRAQEPWRDA